MATLHIVSGTHSGESFSLELRETLLGRHPDCQCVLRDSTVSRRHARITRDANGYVLDDVGSQHGTRLNGELVRSPLRLRDGDEIVLSNTKLIFIDEESTGGGSARSSTIVTSVDLLSDVKVEDKTESTPRWRALLEITRSLGVSLELEEILPNVLNNIIRLLPQATRGTIGLLNRDTGELVPFATFPADSNDEVISRTVSEQVLAEGKAVLSSDATDDEPFSVERFSAGSADALHHLCTAGWRRNRTLRDDPSRRAGP